ncbi:hypothetical protein QYM36_011240 [Artemia franciscana]|uniref:Uncharacterized protein n=1 Tax=Artemia franciscana TaxID=6661 RepID=A0AA88HI76_ARTSF|nr:hypothetical protein QYM36_011240 [Artemia franciscana]
MLQKKDNIDRFRQELSAISWQEAYDEYESPSAAFDRFIEINGMGRHLTALYPAECVPNIIIKVFKFVNARNVDIITVNTDILSNFVGNTDVAGITVDVSKFFVYRGEPNANTKVRMTIDDKSTKKLRVTLACTGWNSVYEETDSDAMAPLFIVETFVLLLTLHALY